MTLYELNTLVRETLEDGLPERYWVEAELSEGRVGYGGHFYGELVQKDRRDGRIIAKARANCWANVYRNLAREFEEATGETMRAGLTVMVEVEVTFHQQYGFSLNITDIDPTCTLGDMARRRQQILRRLEADGILHDNQTLPLPTLMQRIAVVSSEGAAGYGDFCNQLQNNDYGLRFSIRLFPAVMQGKRVEETVIAALEQIASESDRWDAAVVIRGGGATSDLSDFDSYPLAACIAQMPLPVFTGIGHERDETVLDYVAHTRLKTPTAVASFLIDHLAETAFRLDDLGRRIPQLALRRLEHEAQRVAHLSAVLPLAFRSVRAVSEGRLQQIVQRLAAAHRQRRLTEAHRLDMLEQRLRATDPDLLLRRGFSMTLSQGRLLTDVAGLQPGTPIVTRLLGGEVLSVVNEVKPKNQEI